jgi:hypothetical protein
VCRLPALLTDGQAPTVPAQTRLIGHFSRCASRMARRLVS